MAFVVDRLLPAELDAGLRLSTQAGWNQVAADWKRVLDLCPDAVFAGRLGGRVVATGSVASIGPKIRWIGLILVDESLRGRGYGSLMMDHCLALARRAGDEIVGLDASDQGRPVYLKKGFVDVAPIDRWTGTLKVAGPQGNIAALESTRGDLALHLDRLGCGVDRSALLRHLFTGPGSRLFVVPDLGYAVLSPGRLSSHVGPIVAANDAVLVALLDRLARDTAGGPVFIDALRTAETTALLEARGMSISRKLTRMTLGRSQPVLMGPSIRAAISFTWG